MLDFGVLPPEINSTRMYSGPGAGPMMAASAAWDALAAELYSVAAGYGSIVSELASDGWLGPASLSMAGAAAPYVAWLHGTATQAEQTAAHAKAAAAAYEFAFAMTVPPPTIAANRSLLMALVATNFLGQNTPAIAATEAHYAEMWLQDATAMYGYAGSSAAASQLASFTEPPPTTTPAGLAAQSGVAGHAAGSAAAAQSTTLSQPMSTMPGALAAPAAAPNPLSASTVLVTAISATKIVNTVISSSSSGASGQGILIANERLAFQEARDAEAAAALRLVSATPVGMGGSPVSGVSAGMGRATMVGKLSVPASWATAAPEIRPLALTLPDTGAGIIGFAATGSPPVPGNVFSQSVLGMLSRHGADPPRIKSKPIIVRSPAAG
ncbi:MAG: PPE family protein [Mycobacterium sp.]